MPRLSWTPVLLFTFPAVAGMTGTCHHTQLFFVEMGSHELFALTDLQQSLSPELSTQSLSPE
jgi:hypothetical protein